MFDAPSGPTPAKTFRKTDPLQAVLRRVLDGVDDTQLAELEADLSCLAVTGVLSCRVEALLDICGDMTDDRIPAAA